MKALTKEWLKKAKHDRLLAKLAAESAVAFHDSVCFHCQQCVEKCFKGLLQEVGISFPRTHNLELLLDLVAGTHPSLRRFRRQAKLLTAFGVDFRYPGKAATRRQAQSALRTAEQVEQETLKLLAPKAKPKRGKK